MDPDRRLLLGGGALVALSAVVSVFAYPEMPAEMATHWNASGDVDGTMSRELGLALLPALSLGTLGLFYVLPRVDPATTSRTSGSPTTPSRSRPSPSSATYTAWPCW